MADRIVEAYDKEFAELADRWEGLAFEAAHAAVLDFVPAKPGVVFDIGAGSGRDAAWFADRGWHVIAVEPAPRLREHARTLHPSDAIIWEDDRLPNLERLMKRGVQADLVWLSAVWMHLPADDRRRAFRKLATLLKPGGRMMISLRHGPAPSFDRPMHAVPAEEVERLALEHGLTVRKSAWSADAGGREGVSWTALVLELPDDGTGALPIVRGIILQDAKSATYKLALLRVIARIADQSASLARPRDNEVELPLGLVALYWLRMFKRLVEQDIPQLPKHRDGKGIGFAKDAFWQLGDISPYELRPGATFAPPRSQLIVAALRDAADTIKNKPAFFLTYQDGRQIFPTESSDQRPRPAAVELVTIHPAFLWSFGTTRVPLHLWVALRRLAVWIEPMLLAEWTRLIEGYAARQEREIPLQQIAEALKWSDPRRDTLQVREIVRRLLDQEKPVFCVWSGKKITDLREMEIDHCFPFAAWPCDDLWNLMPATRAVNNRKSDRLVTLDGLKAAEDAIANWWRTAYRSTTEFTARRFEQEAQSSLPVDLGAPHEDASPPGLHYEGVAFAHAHKAQPPLQRATKLTDDAIFEAMRYQRLRLQQDQQLPDWDGVKR